MPRFFNGWFTTAPDPAPPGGFTSLHGDAEAACSDGGRKGWQRIWRIAQGTEGTEGTEDLKKWANPVFQT